MPYCKVLPCELDYTRTLNFFRHTTVCLQKPLVEILTESAGICEVYADSDSPRNGSAGSVVGLCQIGGVVVDVLDTTAHCLSRSNIPA
jgi:hypothetical protein